ncbi:MAG: MtaA/CmuA family methyltransferase [Deltaproteobacteria bacterium]|jgi:[methyl-Co(III) methanol-specific corrinoid protein]:coenzyme M methyltransferase|nr:MtaA/CmuA family methyltransferase [Deltaproteobacteria bacterium]
MIKSTPHNLAMSYIYGGRQGERPAAINPTSLACVELMKASEAFFPEAHLKPETMARLALAGHQLLGFDSVMPEYSVHQESAAFGVEMDWGGPTMMPDSKTFPHGDFSPVTIPENILEKPSLSVVLRALEILRREVGGKATIIGKVMGPWTLSYHMAGTQNFLMAVGRKKFDAVRKMVESLAPLTIAFANAQFKAGADAVVVADHATGNLVGPYHYRDLLLPIHKELFKAINGPVILHVCGRTLDRMDLFAESGVDVYHFESANNAAEALEKVGGRITLAGNVNNPEVLLEGGPETVYQKTRELVAAGLRLLAPECAIPLTTPLASLKAIVEAAREGF